MSKLCCSSRWSRWVKMVSWLSVQALLFLFHLPQPSYGEARWVGVETPYQPPARSNPGFIYDSQADRFMVFGGRTWKYFPPLMVNNNSWFNDGWFFKNGTWTRLEYGLAFDSFGPYPAQYRGRFVWNPVEEEVLLSGGSFNRNFGYTVIFKNGQFIELEPMDDPPPFLEGGCFNPFDGCYYFVDNVAEVYKYDGAAWTQQSPEGIPAEGHLYFGGATSFNPLTQQIVYFGGAKFPENTLLGETFIYSIPLNKWTTHSITPHPPAALYPAMVYHPDRGRHVLCGGYAGEDYPGRVSGEIWEFNEAGLEWTQISVENPRGVSDHGVVFHPTERRIYVFGGWLGDLGLSSDLLYLSNLPSATSEIVTPTPIDTPTFTPSQTPTLSATSTPSWTSTSSPTFTATSTPTATVTDSPTEPLPTETPTPSNTPLVGDLSLNGSVGPEDIILLLQHWGMSTSGE